MQDFDNDSVLSDIPTGFYGGDARDYAFYFYFPEEYSRGQVVRLEISKLEKMINEVFEGESDMHVICELPMDGEQRLFLCYEFVYEDEDGSEAVFPDGCSYFWALVCRDSVSFSFEEQTLEATYRTLSSFLSGRPNGGKAT